MQFGRCVIYLYLMGESLSRVFDRALFNFDTEFEKCWLLNCLDNSAMKYWFQYLIFMMGRVGLGVLLCKKTR